jgi:hypothetical protein
MEWFLCDSPADVTGWMAVFWVPVCEVVEDMIMILIGWMGGRQTGR